MFPTKHDFLFCKNCFNPKNHKRTCLAEERCPFACRCPSGGFSILPTKCRLFKTVVCWNFDYSLFLRRNQFSTQRKIFKTCSKSRVSNKVRLLFCKILVCFILFSFVSLFSHFTFTPQKAAGNKFFCKFCVFAGQLALSRCCSSEQCSCKKYLRSI